MYQNYKLVWTVNGLNERKRSYPKQRKSIMILNQVIRQHCRLIFIYYLLNTFYLVKEFLTNIFDQSFSIYLIWFRIEIISHPSAIVRHELFSPKSRKILIRKWKLQRSKKCSVSFKKNLRVGSSINYVRFEEGGVLQRKAYWLGWGEVQL